MEGTRFKFRAWDKCNERMVEPRNILKICMSRLNQEPYLIVYLKKWMNENREIKESDKNYTNEFELMQYTGLKNKNGAEIYEGDIISRENTYENNCVVKWDDESCGFTLNYIYFDESYDMNEFWDDFEVIGNIYENKDLLKEEE